MAAEKQCFDNEDNDEGGEWIASLAAELKSNDQTLTEVELDGEEHHVGNDEISLFCESLKQNNTVNRIGFTGLTISSKGLLALVAVLKTKKHLKELWFEGVHDTSDSLFELLAVALCFNKGIGSLSLRGCCTEKPIPAFSIRALMNSAQQLSDLCLSHNLIDLQTATALANALSRNHSLISLDLTGSSMHCQEIQQLCTGLSRNETLESLVLDFNNSFQDEGTASISSMLKNHRSLSNLQLFGNGISSTGASLLSEALVVNTSLLSLNLSFNCIGDEGTSLLAKALTINSTLSGLWISNNSFGHKGVQELANQLPKMKGLETLDLGMLLDEDSVEALTRAMEHNHVLQVLHFEQPGLLEEEETMEHWSLRLDFFLRLNRSGRRHRMETIVAPALFSHILERGSQNSSSDGTPDVLHYVLRENPELL